MSLLVWIAVGNRIGYFATKVLPTAGAGGKTGDLVIGVIGAVFGGWIMVASDSAGAFKTNIWSLCVAYISACVLLGIVRILSAVTVRSNQF